MTNQPGILVRNEAAYQQIARGLRESMGNGSLAAGEVLPSYRRLAATYGVSLATVQQATGLLMSEGLLEANGNRVCVALRQGPVDSASPLRRSTPDRSTVRSILPPHPAAVKPEQRAAPALHVGIITGLPEDHGMPKQRDMSYEMVQHVERYMSKRGVTSSFVGIAGYESRAEHVKDAIMGLVERGADALLLVGISEVYLEGGVLQAVQRASKPVIVAGFQDVRLPLPHVFYDDRHAASEAARHLIEQGCERIAFFSPIKMSWVMERFAGVRDALTHYGRGLGTVVESIGDRDAPYFAEEPLRSMAIEAARPLARALERGAGIVACNDRCALAFMEVAAEQGLAAGKDYLIVAFDDLPEARFAGLSTVPPPLQEIGEQAARLLMETVAGESAAMRVSVRSHVIVRQTSRTTFTRNTVG